MDPGTLREGTSTHDHPNRPPRGHALAHARRHHPGTAGQDPPPPRPQTHHLGPNPPSPGEPGGGDFSCPKILDSRPAPCPRSPLDPGAKRAGKDILPIDGGLWGARF
jgi:hypothetical protein